MEHLIITIILTSFVFLFYLINRNSKVLDFRLKVLDFTTNKIYQVIEDGTYNHCHDYYKVFEKYSYGEQLFKYPFTKLTLEAWFTEEEIEEYLLFSES